ncbi:hypothetical protein WJX84_011310 [Apatococcus fuscideae]|uniref:Tryptophan synthase beta chain-like PALP domain-containing protein n=1 Tax=Apatococcus fuscideae TaxID=2026836 RepID=A0AAW1T728_9CHLO
MASKVGFHLTLPAGYCSGAVSHVGPAQQHPLDIFRCSGCTRDECQGSGGCAEMQWRWESDGYLKKILTASVYDVAINSNLEVAERLSEQLGNTLLLKRTESVHVFSFKCRGAFNKMKNLTQEQRQHGVVCSSAGNHAQGVALAAARLECEALVCMPETTPEIKVKAVRRAGRQGGARGESIPRPMPMLRAGTVGQEILAQLHQLSAKSSRTHFVPVGGEASLLALVPNVKALRPEVRIIGWNLQDVFEEIPGPSWSQREPLGLWQAPAPTSNTTT